MPAEGKADLPGERLTKEKPRREDAGAETVVGGTRVELVTSAMSTQRSNQLS